MSASGQNRSSVRVTCDSLCSQIKRAIKQLAGSRQNITDVFTQVAVRARVRVCACAVRVCARVWPKATTPQRRCKCVGPVWHVR